MDEESHGSGPNGGSPESPCLKNNNNNKNNTTNKEQDRFLPIANVGRIMKKVSPTNGKISKDAKETVQECVSEFISFVTGEASDKCQREKRKTINGDDIIWAITILGFEDYVAPLKLYLNKYREIEGEKLNIPKQQRTSTEQRLLQQQQAQVKHEQNLPPSYTQIKQEQNLPPSYAQIKQEQSLPPHNTVYSSTAAAALMSQPSLVAADPPFSLTFSPNSIQKQLQQQQDQIDSIGHW